MDLLVSNAARERFGALLRTGLGDGKLLTPGEPGAEAAEVAWLSTDLFYGPEARDFFRTVADAPGLAWLQSCAAGADLKIYERLLRRGVRVTASHENAISIAEFVIGSVLRVSQAAEHFAEAQRAHRWAHQDFDELAGTSWCLVGYGAIGQRVAERAQAFGVSVTAVRRRPEPSPFATVVGLDGLAEAVSAAQVVVLARPGAAAEPPLVDDAFLRRLRPGSVLVNVARGNLIDEAALLRGLAESRPQFAILDVFSTEPLPQGHPFWDHPQVVVTPHAAAGGRGRYERNAALLLANLERYRRGEPLPDELTLGDLPDSSAVPAQFRHD